MNIKDYISVKLYSEDEKVIVLPHLEQVDRNLGCGTTQKMEELSGCVFTIKSVYESPYGKYIGYHFCKDYRGWAWNNHMILPFSSSLESWCYKNIEKVVDDFSNVNF